METRCKHGYNKFTYSQNFITLKWPDMRHLQRCRSTSRGPSLISSHFLSLSGSTVGAQTQGGFFWGQEHKNSCLEQFLQSRTTDSSDPIPLSKRNKEECTNSPLNTASAAPLGSHIPAQPSAHSRKNVVWGGGVKQDRGQRVGKSFGGGVGRTVRDRQKKGKAFTNDSGGWRDRKWKVRCGWWGCMQGWGGAGGLF